MNKLAGNRTAVIDQIIQQRLIAIIRVPGAEEAVSVGHALRRAGMRLIEVTFTVPDAPAAVARLTREAPEVIVGVGSVLTLAQAEEALAAGACFFVSPILNLDLIRWCQAHRVVSMVAGFTPTELFRAWQAGSDFVKLFPAGAAGGPAYVRDVLAPLPDLPLVPTGGVTLENCHAYLEAGARAVGLGSALVPRPLVARRAWTALTEHAAQFVAALAPS